MKFIGILLVAFGCLTSEIAAAQEYDFREATLGMTLAEFQALTPINGKVLRDGTATSCRPANDPSDAQRGHLKCMRAGDDPFAAEGGYQSSPSYYFGRDTQGATRLYMILIISKRDNFITAVASLTQKWGEGKSSKTTVTNGLGTAIPKTTISWKKSASEITLESPCEDVRNLCISYEHNLLQVEILKSKGPSANSF